MRDGLTTSAKASVVRRSFSEGGRPSPYKPMCMLPARGGREQ